MTFYPVQTCLKMTPVLFDCLFAANASFPVVEPGLSIVTYRS